jgi:hypothetical protein
VGEVLQLENPCAITHEISVLQLTWAGRYGVSVYTEGLYVLYMLYMHKHVTLFVKLSVHKQDDPSEAQTKWIQNNGTNQATPLCTTTHYCFSGNITRKHFCPLIFTSFSMRKWIKKTALHHAMH